MFLAASLASVLWIGTAAAEPAPVAAASKTSVEQKSAQGQSAAKKKVIRLDAITVEKSPICRLDSDCWDVKLKFFDPDQSACTARPTSISFECFSVKPLESAIPLMPSRSATFVFRNVMPSK